MQATVHEPVGTGARQEKLSSAYLETLKGPRSVHLPAVLRAQGPSGDTPMCAPGDQKGPSTPVLSQPLSACSSLAQRPSSKLSCLHPWRCRKGSTVGSSTSLVTVRAQSSLLREHANPCLQSQWPTSVWAVEPEMAMAHGQSYPTLNRDHPVIRQQLSQGPGGSHTCCTLGSRPTV